MQQIRTPGWNGEDKAEESSEKTQDLLEAHPDLKVICALTSSGITAAAKTISEAETSVKITGLAGESVEADSIEGSPFEITALPDDPEATEILLGSMTCFTPDNVSQWAEVF